MEVRLDQMVSQCLCSEDGWALSEFGDAPLPDERLKNGW
jgi:hypothetical protein